MINLTKEVAGNPALGSDLEKAVFDTLVKTAQEHGYQLSYADLENSVKNYSQSVSDADCKSFFWTCSCTF
ncbi:hypothetical protein KFE98_15990 [bacterium SCSIO 12741]|nr:hypothetical protein KFE98_15990 [bacterium SCSIO 12741]